MFLVRICSAALIFGSVGCSADSVDVVADTESVDVEPEPAEMSYEGQVQPILEKWCGDCHTGNAPGVCPGDTCFVSFFDDILLPAETCEGHTKAECGLRRIEASRDPTTTDDDLTGLMGPIVLPDDDYEILRRWIRELGAPER
jgi:hypothetical protein